MLWGAIEQEVENCIRALSEQKKCEAVELNVRMDHVHLIVSIPPKLSVSDYAGIVKGRSAIRVLSRFKELKRKPYWGNHFWTKVLCRHGRSRYGKDPGLR